MKILKLNVIAVCSLMVLLMACSKKEAVVTLPDSSVSFDLTGRDTIQLPVSILENTTMVLEIKAALMGVTSTDSHNVTFAVDTTKIVDYRAKYGTANLLPALNYFFYKAMAVLPAGAAKSDAAQLNIAQQMSLTEYSTYVLPVVIRSVDGKTEGAGSSRVIYYVFKTGKPLFVNKTGWTATQSSANTTALAGDKVIDANNATTYWLSSTAQTMPQWVVINLGKDVTFTGLAYYFPTAVAYPTAGGFPTSFQVETSSDGTTWVSKGIFAGNLVNNMQTVTFPSTTARYVRFTSLAVKKYSNLDVVFISGISLVP